MKRTKDSRDVFETNGQKFPHRLDSLSSNTQLVKYDFGKRKDKTKIIVWSLAIFLCVACLGNFIATSFGTFDDDMSAIFYPALDSKFLRGWAGYTIMDGYCTVLGYAIPAGMLCIESVWIFVKKIKPNWWISQHYSLYKYCIIIAGIIFELVSIKMFYYWNWQDQGFGNGYDVEFIIGKEFTIPIWVVSILLGNVVFWTLSWWFHFKLAQRPDFLELKPWRPIITSFIYMAAGYIVVQYTKSGIGRPYWYNVHFTDGLTAPGADPRDALGTSAGGYHIKGVLERFREYDMDAFNHYIHSNYYGRGWLGDSTFGKLAYWPNEWNGHTGLRNWYWWMSQESVGYPPMSGGAFPSGHMIATAFIALSPTYIFIAPSKSRKYNTIKNICYALSFIYLLDMVFALQISASHWWSDSMFSLGFGLAFYGIGYGFTHGVLNGLNKLFHTNNW